MADGQFFTYKVEERSYVSLVKKDIRRIVLEAGFAAGKAGEIDIIVSELTSNLIKHADNGGELIYRIGDDGGKPFFEIFAMDLGPGSNEIQRMLRDGISSTNTLGHGLGAITRLSDFSQIFSMRNWGTIVYSKKFSQSPSENYTPKPPILIRGVQESYPGEKKCGDGFHIKYLNHETQIFLGDGLGHGVHAHDAVAEAITAFKECKEDGPVAMLRYIHTQVKKTRGLVATIAIYNHEKKLWRIAGIGNISTRLYNGLEYKNYAPHNGIIGLNIPNTMKSHDVEAEKFQLIIMASDGIKTKWELAKYTSILKYDPAVIAAAIFKDNARKTDDMTIVVGKINM